MKRSWASRAWWRTEGVGLLVIILALLHFVLIFGLSMTANKNPADAIPAQLTP